MDTPPLSASQLAELGAYDTPTVCNVIELFGARPHTAGYMDGRVKSCFPRLDPMVGFAVTATYRAAAPTDMVDPYKQVEAQIRQFADLPGPAVVVIQDLDDPPVAATFGEMMCTAYKGFGAAGLITSGAGRDLLQVQALGFPVFTSGTICSHGYCCLADIGTPVRVGGIVVRPGDLLHGDANGVTTIPLDIAGRVADACREFVDTELPMLEYFKNTTSPTMEGYVEARDEGMRRARVLRERLRGGR